MVERNKILEGIGALFMGIFAFITGGIFLSTLNENMGEIFFNAANLLIFFSGVLLLALFVFIVFWIIKSLLEEFGGIRI